MAAALDTFISDSFYRRRFDSRAFIPKEGRLLINTRLRYHQSYFKHVPKLQGSYAYQIRDTYKDLSDEEVIKKIHAKFKDKIDFSEIERDYGRKLERLSSEKAKAVGIWFLVWLIPSLATYALGWSVSWVLTGFQAKRNG